MSATLLEGYITGQAQHQQCASPVCDPMSRVDVARLMLRNGITGENAAIMVAIAEAESSLRPCAGGDCPTALIAAGSSQANVDRAQEWSCPPFNDLAPASWGLWQIFAGVHHSDVAAFFGIPDEPCIIATVLQDPENNAAFAARLARSVTGFRHWTTYNTGAYLQYLPAARLAVSAAAATEPSLPIPGVGTLSTLQIVGAGLIVGGALLLVAFREPR